VNVAQAQVAKIKIKQIGSPIRRTKDQRATLIGLGLNKMHEVSLEIALQTLHHGAEASRLALNPPKIQPPGSTVTNFNMTFGSGSMFDTEERMKEFKNAFEAGNEYVQLGIYGYVHSINKDQADELL